MSKFNVKEFKGKNRVYTKVTNYPRISKLWIWNEEGNEYRPPEFGKAYLAKKYLNRKRVNQFFATLAEAVTWQNSSIQMEAEDKGKELLFSDFLTAWRNYKYPRLEASTQDQYEKLIRLYFNPLQELALERINPVLVDSWIEYLKNPNSGFTKNVTRKSFKHELILLNSIFNDYLELTDETAFRNPIKRRHWQAIVLRIDKKASKDITEDQFNRFLDELEKQTHGKILKDLATVQFYHGLRISEVAALSWEDIQFNDLDPSKSRVTISKSVEYMRRKGSKPRLKVGFKNSKSNGSVKEHPLFPQSYAVLSKRSEGLEKGLVFHLHGEIIPYRTIQNAYDKAFESAGLEFSGTHIMRHGGTRYLFNKRPERSLAGQLLGNKDNKSIDTYAQRSSTALNDFAAEEWKLVIATDCKNQRDKAS